MDSKAINRIWSLKYSLYAILALVSLQFLLFISLCAGDNVHIVYMGEKRHENPSVTKRVHHKMLSELLGSNDAAKRSILYSYRHGFSGFAAKLTESQAAKVSELPGVVQVIPNHVHNLHTTRSWEFIGLHHNTKSQDNLLTQSSMGRGTIIGIIDTGIWPESESFNDRGMSPVPPHWKGICQKGERFNSSNCNKKLIGARWFIKGLRQYNNGPINGSAGQEFLSARDGIGHGTHTASTAGGSFVTNASYKGLAQGLARGGAPFAHVAIYKACWGGDIGECSDADLLKAFDKAIQDGVDVLSVSVGTAIPLFPYVDHRDSIAIGSFHATSKGITVICSAGNDGPISQTIVNTAPWIITVAATTIDRTFQAFVTLGNQDIVMGQSIDTGKPIHDFVGLTYSERIAADPKNDSAKDCSPGSLNATLASGKIILCLSQSEDQDIVSASNTVSLAGGVGLIYAQFHNDGLDSCDLIPCIKVDYEVGTQILSYIRKAKSAVAKLSFPRTNIGKSVSPQVASFSSRGPSSITPSVLKPDIAAPGVDILAAFRPIDGEDGKKAYALLSGTSMSCPHVAGIVALIKSIHRHWSPAAIRSALVTTASQTGTDGDSIHVGGPTGKLADPFDIGGGQVNPEKAVNPGLVYNITTSDYVQFLCSVGYSKKSITKLTRSRFNCTTEAHDGLNLNLPSITIPSLTGKTTVTRTVTNVGHGNAVYKAIVHAPFGVTVTVKPETLEFDLNVKTISFNVTFLANRKVEGVYKFGSLIWTDGEHVVRSPMVVRVVETFTHTYQ